MASMPETNAPCFVSPRILAETLEVPIEPLALLVDPLVAVPPADACRVAARALLDLPHQPPAAPPWLAPHQVRAFDRIHAIVRRFGGAVLADAVGSGKSYVALAVAHAAAAPLVLVVPAVLVDQWRALIARLSRPARIETHERLSRDRKSLQGFAPGSFVVVDEAHHFRNPETRRYGTLARLVVHSRVLLVTATPVYNRPADLIHLLRFFLRDDALVAYGVPSLLVAAREPRVIPVVRAAVARIVVARSRLRVAPLWDGKRFPEREEGRVIRAAPAEPERLATLIEGVQRLRPPGAAALHRLTLLRRLASSVPALRQSLRRYEAFRSLARDAGVAQRRLTPREFRRVFALEDDADLQLAFLPLLLEAGTTVDEDPDDWTLVRRLLDEARVGPDPKAAALGRYLEQCDGKTIVFIQAAATVQHLRRQLPRSLRLAALCGAAGWLGFDRVSRCDVLAAFAPRSLGVAPLPEREQADVLLATDLIGEGLNLHDARRVIHYDLPWSPARLAQRVGRIDRLGSPHTSVETVSFLPIEPLAAAQDIEERLAAKVAMQIGGGVAQIETTSGGRGGNAPFDWCDRLQRLAAGAAPASVGGVRTSVAAMRDAVVLVVAFGLDVEVIVVEDGAARADPDAATSLLAQAHGAGAAVVHGPAIAQAMQVAAPLVRARLADIAAARWRAADRDQPGRRLIPMVLAAARRAAQGRRADRLGRLDGLVARLTGGLTAGESLLLDDLIADHRPFDVTNLLAWHDGLPPVAPSAEAPIPRLVAAIRLARCR
ncbi:MAG TPA: helicase-related protein [Gemmatimonadales bacterium]|nr:helicase-related protein [Gemmatimonadales bacterium]